MDIKIEHAVSRHKQVLARLGLIESVNALNGTEHVSRVRFRETTLQKGLISSNYLFFLLVFIPLN